MMNAVAMVWGTVRADALHQAQVARAQIFEDAPQCRERQRTESVLPLARSLKSHLSVIYVFFQCVESLGVGLSRFGGVHGSVIGGEV